MDSAQKQTLGTFTAGVLLGAAGLLLMKQLRSPRSSKVVSAAASAVGGSKGQLSPPKLPKMTLHLYDHCPYCIKVELVLGWKGIPYERKVYGYGDSLGDPKKGLYFGGRTLTGKKQLPVLEVEGKPLLPESGDIVAYLEGLLGPGNVLLPPLSGRKDLKDFFASKGEFKKVFPLLTRPATIKLTHLADWSKKEDIEYALTKYEGQGFDYKAAEAAEQENIAIMNGLLEQLDGMIYSPTQLGEGLCQFTWDDITYLPNLRTLTSVKGLKWPDKLKSYVVNSLNKANVASYFS